MVLISSKTCIQTCLTIFMGINRIDSSAILNICMSNRQGNCTNEVGLSIAISMQIA